MTFTGQSLIIEVLDLFDWERNPQNWTEEILSEFNPTFVRLKRVTALLSAIELNCSAIEFFTGQFWVSQEPDRKKHALKVLNEFNFRDLSNSIQIDFNEIFIIPVWQGIWHHLISCSQFRSNIVKWNEGGLSMIQFMDSFSRSGIDLQQIDSKIELCIQLLSELLGISNFSMDEMDIQKNYGFPLDDLTAIDLDWESR